MSKPLPRFWTDAYAYHAPDPREIPGCLPGPDCGAAIPACHPMPDRNVAVSACHAPDPREIPGCLPEPDPGSTKGIVGCERLSSRNLSSRNRAGALYALLLACLLALAACTGPHAVYDAENSPVLISATLETYNEGSDDRQYVKVTLTFDRNVSVATDYIPPITIAQAGIDTGNIKVVEDGARLSILIHTDKVRDGDLILLLAPEGDEAVVGLTDTTGTYAAANSSVYALVPSGVALARTGTNTVEVTHAFNIRGIAWVVLHDGDEVVGGSLLAGADSLDGAVALHGHDFLTEDAYDVAAALAETMTSHFGDRYSFTAEGKTVLARSLSNPAAEVTISVYEYQLVVAKPVG